MANRTFKSPGEMNKESVGNYATVNGLKMYYEVHGTAGAGGSRRSFSCTGLCRRPALLLASCCPSLRSTGR